MPRKRTRKRPKRYTDELSHRQLYHLVRGTTYDFLPGPEFSRAHYKEMTGSPRDIFPFLSHQQRRDMYFQYKDYLISLIGQRPGDLDNPNWHPELKFCERPDAMYTYEFEPKYGPRQKVEDIELSSGQIVKLSAINNLYESQETYLERHGLLMPNEIENRAAADERAEREKEEFREKISNVVDLDEYRGDEDPF